MARSAISLLRRFSSSVSSCVSGGRYFSQAASARPPPASPPSPKSPSPTAAASVLVVFPAFSIACFPGTTCCHQKSLSALYISAQYSGSRSTLYMALPPFTV